MDTRLVRLPVTGFSLRHIALGIAIVGLACAMALVFHPILGNLASTLLLVIAILVVGASQGLIAGLIAAAIAFLMFNFFMAEPVLKLSLASGEDIAPFIAFNVTAIIAGVLSGKLRDRAAAAERAGAWNKVLLEAGNEVQAAINREAIEDRLRWKAASALGLTVDIYLPELNGMLAADVPLEVATCWSERREVRARQSISLLMAGISGPTGVLRASGAWMDHAEFLQSYATLAAIALERADFSARMSEVQALERSEELKSALLSSVSHDFRTPLAAITASASSIKDFEQQITAEQRDFFLATILSECKRLDNYTANLLELSKLEAGIRPLSQLIEVSDVTLAVSKQYHIANSDRCLTLNVPSGLIVQVNATLFELALSNILTNAVEFSRPGNRIEVNGARLGSSIVIEVRDEGCGIPIPDLERVFDKFHSRSDAALKSGGTGLGLAIAKGFVTATGGTIWAETPGIGEVGSTVAMQLPAIDVEVGHAFD